MSVTMPYHRLAQLSLICFLCQLPTILLHEFFIKPYYLIGESSIVLIGLILLLTTSYSLLFVVLGKLFFLGQDGDFSVWWRATFIGYVFAIGLHVSIEPLHYAQQFGWYLVFLAFFHFSEYFATAYTNPSNLSTDSFLLNHSPAYHVAAVLSWAEFFLELTFYPPLKSSRVISYVGIGVCLAGEILRKLAMITAGKSFNHIVQSARQEDHVLVTKRVFGLVRHPSYLGWFLWSVGTQLILVNPVCFVAYTVISWLFFKERIYVEEYTLYQFFGESYHAYKQKVPYSGLPFISGYDQARYEEEEEEEGD